MGLDIVTDDKAMESILDRGSERRRRSRSEAARGQYGD